MCVGDRIDRRLFGDARHGADHFLRLLLFFRVHGKKRVATSSSSQTKLGVSKGNQKGFQLNIGINRDPMQILFRQKEGVKHVQ